MPPRIAVNPELYAADPSCWQALGEPVAQDDCDAVAWIVRSTLRVDRDALDRRPLLRHVATASSGTDHLDLAALDARGIDWMACPGSNADAVADWVAIACERLDFSGGTLGVIGVGHVGRHVASRYPGPVLLCDPPRAAREKDFPHVPLAQVLARADAITLHTPLDPTTFHLIDRRAIDRFSGRVLLNAARGDVVAPEAIADLRARGGSIALDVFPDEPHPDPSLLGLADFATPHIAGHTVDAKNHALRRCAYWLAEKMGRTVSTQPSYRAAAGTASAILADAHTRLRHGEAFAQVRRESLRPALSVTPGDGLW